jgi:hypothetical protein
MRGAGHIIGVSIAAVIAVILAAVSNASKAVSSLMCASTISRPRD